MDIGKILALGAAGWIAYEYFFATPAPAKTTPPGGIQPGPTPPAQTSTNPQTTQGMILNLANAEQPPFTQGTADQWNFYYQEARGIPAPDPLTYLTADTRGEILTFPEWWNLASAHGLSGMRGGYVRSRF